MGRSKDADILRALAEQYAVIAAKPIQDQRRALWRNHYSLRRTRPMVLCLWLCALREIIGPRLQCEDRFYRGHETWLRTMIFQDTLGDDLVAEPWITQRTVFKDHGFKWAWGFDPGIIPSTQPGGAWQNNPPIKSLEDADTRGRNPVQ